MKKTALLLLLAGLISPPGAFAVGDFVTEWNQTALMLNAPYGPQRGGRTLAMMHSAIYDAVMAFQGTSSPYYVVAIPPAGASLEAAVTAAAHHVLSSVFTETAELATIQACYEDHLTEIVDGQGKTDGIAFGVSVGQAIVALRAADGMAAALTTTHPDGTDPGEWRRTASGEPVAPGWGNVTPWMMTTGNQFDQGGPPALDSAEYAADYLETMTIGDINSTLLTQDQIDAVMFWADHVPAKWYAVARDISGREQLSLAENAQLFELLSLTMADATIAGWDMKYNYNFWRPETAIHEGDNDLNPDTVGDPAWMSRIPSPAFPEYVSGHSITSSAAANILELYFRNGDYTFQLPGMSGHGPRTFDSFQAAAEEAGQSRIWGGIHFQFANQDGLLAGSELANFVFNTLMPNTAIGIFRPSSGLWDIQGTPRAYFGTRGDTPVYRDYDGDGTGDLAIFRGSTGLWAIKGITRAYLGTSSDLPVPADYDGNGSCDIGIFREASGLWAVRGVTRAYFGRNGDVPVPGDFSGNGRSDLAVFRPASGLWAVKGVTRVTFGSSADQPVPKDYDGDGMADIAVFSPASGLWAVRGVTRACFGRPGDVSVPWDYEGDGTADIGIFRDSSGLWAIRGVSQVYHGRSGDVPITR